MLEKNLSNTPLQTKYKDFIEILRYCIIEKHITRGWDIIMDANITLLLFKKMLMQAIATFHAFFSIDIKFNLPLVQETRGSPLKPGGQIQTGRSEPDLEMDNIG